VGLDLAKHGVCYLYVVLKIPHTKVTGAQIYLLGQVLVFVRGQFGQKVEAILGEIIELILERKRGGLGRMLGRFSRPFAMDKVWV
jgi:hypothetical protein